MGVNLQFEKEGFAKRGINVSSIKNTNDIWDSPFFDEERRLEKLDFENKTSKMEMVPSGEICGKCKSDNTFGFSKQTRSGDEGVTHFIICMNCGSKWRE